MNRLTFKEDGKWILKQDDNITRAREREELAQQAIDRLAEYEDMEEQGLLVRLPCKIGATVYRFQRYFNDATLKSEIKIKPCVVESVSTKCIITTDHMVMLFSNFGKTVFLTREEAEKALEGNNEQA